MATRRWSAEKLWPVDVAVWPPFVQIDPAEADGFVVVFGRSFDTSGAPIFRIIRSLVVDVFPTDGVSFVIGGSRIFEGIGAGCTVVFVTTVPI